MAAPPPPRRRVSPPAIPDEIVEEILLRFPPDEPACLLRSSLVCKDWGCAVSRPDFRRRLHELHRAPPMLGFLHDWQDESIPHFVPTTASPFSFAAPDWLSWRAIDCRHGRALFLSNSWDADELLVWEPITGAQQRIPVPLPPEFEGNFLGVPFGAAVFCSADGCHHRDCLGGPFGLCFVFCVNGEYAEGEMYVTSACVYSSENGTWGELTSMHGYDIMNFGYYSSVLVGRSLLYFMAHGRLVLEYDLARHNLTVLDTPISSFNIGRFNLMLAEDGGVGVSHAFCAHLILWSREENDGARWVASRVIHLENLLPNGALGVGGGDKRVQVLGFAEGANIIFFNTVAGLFTIELQSERVKKVCPDRGFCNLIPVTGFYTPVPRGKLQNLPTSKPTEEAGDEEGGDEEKTIDQSHHLFDKGSNAIKEGDFVNTFECVSHDLKISVPCYGEGALEGAITLNKHGCALLLKDSSDDVADSAPNEESVKGTTSKDDTMNSTTSDSNAEGAPASEKDLKERILKQQQEEEERKHEWKEKKDAKKKEQTGQAEDIDR